MCSRWLSGGLLTLFATFATAAEIHGHITFESKRRLSRDSPADLAVVFYRPQGDITQSHVESASGDNAVVEMTMTKKAFQPEVIAVPTGTKVSFPNADRVIHNAFSTTHNNKFDLGLYPQGETRAHQFDKPGVVKVFCNVHQNMRGYVIVLDTPYYSKLAPDGSFKLANLPIGPGKLFVWHPRGKTISKVIEVKDATSQFEATMALTKRTLPNHKNKFGKPYKRNRDY